MEKLGAFRQVYPISKHFTRIWVVGQVCIAWGILEAPIVVVARLFSSNPPSLILTQILVAAGLLLLIAGFYMSFSPRIYARWQVSLWQNGFIYEKTHQVFRWSQIESIKAAITYVHNGPAPIIYTYKVRRQDGYEVTLGSVFSNSSELTDYVLEECTRQLAPQGFSIVPPKSTRTFTVFKLDRQGVGNEQEMLSWQEIQEFMPQNGMVILRKLKENS